MDDVKCPRCRAEKIRPVHVIRREEVAALFPYCDACGWVVGQALTSLGAERGGVDGVDRLVGKQVRHLAHWEPRDRLPTDEEVQALRRRHGEGAGWMIRSTDSATPRSYSRPVFLEGDSDLLPGLRRMVSLGIYRLTCWPVTAEGRPVGWPEVNHG